MNERSGLSSCQVVGIISIILVVAVACLGAGLVLGGGLGLVTGGTAGYAIGRAWSTHREPELSIPIPSYPGPGDEEWDQIPPEDMPRIEARPYLGVRYRTVQEGASIASVEPGTPAESVGLLEGDVILAVDGEPVGEGHPDLTARILEHEPGDEVTLRVRRDAEELEIEVTLGVRHVLEGHLPIPPEQLPLPPGQPYLGVRIRQLPEGARVVAVTPDSPAQVAGLRAGDIILAVDGAAVTDETPLAALIAAHEPGDTVALTVERDGQEREIEVQLGVWSTPEDPDARRQG